MKTLNLTDPEISDINFKISKFPDGQQDIIITGWPAPPSSEWVSMISFQDIKISSRLNSFKDLELIVCAAKALRRLKVKDISLYIPYLLGTRSDRQFQVGGTSYLVDVIAPIINSLNFKDVTVIDVHSDVAAACINNLSVINNTKLVKWAFDKISPDKYENKKRYEHIREGFYKPIEDILRSFVLVSPDAGALKKIYNVAKAIDFKGEIIVASKHRDLDGNITHTEVPISGNSIVFGDGLIKDYIIIDDICDGGRTFIEIAKKIKEQGITGKIYLIVTHGIFSAGLKELSSYFDGIYTTNSIMEIDSMNEFGMRNEKYLDKIHQLEIF